MNSDVLTTSVPCTGWTCRKVVPMAEESNCAFAVRVIAALAADVRKYRHENNIATKSSDLDSAANWFANAYPSLTLHILEDIGEWPSSEKELAALQRVSRLMY